MNLFSNKTISKKKNIDRNGSVSEMGVRIAEQFFFLSH